MDNSGITPGAQALRRGLELLRLLGQHQQEGLKLSDAIELAGLERSTVHRLLSCLVEEQFAEKDDASKRYRLGIDAMQLGSAAVRRLPLVTTYRPLMQRLARMSGDTVFLMVRDGDEFVCLHREEGPYPVKVLTIKAGERRLLGISAGGLALLASMDDEEIDDVLTRHKADYEAIGLSPAILLREVRETRRQGYASIVETITPGACGLGRTIPSSLKISAAISFGTITTRFTHPRRTELSSRLASAFKDFRGKRSLR